MPHWFLLVLVRWTPGIVSLSLSALALLLSGGVSVTLWLSYHLRVSGEKHAIMFVAWDMKQNEIERFGKILFESCRFQKRGSPNDKRILFHILYIGDT